MAYVKTTWEHDSKFTTTNMNNCETQYDVAYGEALAHNHDTRYYTRTECDAKYWNSTNDGTGSGCDADLLYKSTGNLHYADFTAGGVEYGCIGLWREAVLPDGWIECDGTSGTPDLRNVFVLGAGNSYAVGASGGSNTTAETYNLTIASHAITATEIPSHRHSVSESCPNNSGIAAGGDYMQASSRLAYSGQTSAATGGGLGHGHTGSTVLTATFDNKPPCVALRYIMKT